MITRVIGILALCAASLLAQEPTKQEIALFRKVGQTARVDIDVKIDGSFATPMKKSRRDVKIRRRADLRVVDIIDGVTDDGWSGRRRYLRFQSEDEKYKTDPEQSGATFSFVATGERGRFLTDLTPFHSRDCLAAEAGRLASLGFTLPYEDEMEIGAEVKLDPRPIMSLLLGLDQDIDETSAKLKLASRDEKTGACTIAGRVKVSYTTTTGRRRIEWNWSLEVELVVDPSLGQFSSATIEGEARLTGEDADIPLKGSAEIKSHARAKLGTPVERDFNSLVRDRRVTRFVAGTDMMIDLPSSWHAIGSSRGLGYGYEHRRGAEKDACKVFLEVERISDGGSLTRELLELIMNLVNGSVDAPKRPRPGSREGIPVPNQPSGTLTRELFTFGDDILVALTMTADSEDEARARRELPALRKSLDFYERK